MSTLKPASFKRSYRAASVLCGALLTLVAGVSSAASIVSQTPLSVGGNVPGNLLLVPSVEWPTLDSMANLGAYQVNRKYVGYFDSDKCYLYKYDADEKKRYFYPKGAAASHACTYTNKEWSGNYLNWAATQTIDPFRKALTGGYRVVDTATETILEKARSDANTGTGIYPDRRVPASGDNSTLVRGATPFDWGYIHTRIRQLGNKMYFTSGGSLDTTTVTVYNPDNTVTASTIYEVSVRVKVCDASVSVESNCVLYGSNYKPEGLIQKYSNRIRFSVFGYLNDSNMLRDGGVLRAKQKFVGEKLIDPSDLSEKSNPNHEWDPATGIFIRNPDSADATATSSVVGKTIEDSGVINYINKFGQMTSQNHKSYDPVSELFYTALRYLRNAGNVPAYSDMAGAANNDTRYNWADGFPVITDWDDPIQYWCQNNAILGIGDANSHKDKNLPGHTGSTTNEPSMPTQVSTDTHVNVVTATGYIATLENITINTPFTGRENSAYIAGLAYDAHTKDLRPGTALPGDQTVSTHWVDVRENQVLEGRARNQYWLAAKYGGFTVPDGYTQGTALTNDSWNSGEYLTADTSYPRPENFYVASEADKMVESLTRAFAKIAAESVGSAASLAANSTRLETDTKTFQAQFYNGSWRGELKAFNVNSDGQLATTPAWTASTQLTAKDWTTRKIYTYTGAGSPEYKLFTYDNLTSTQKTALGGNSNVVNYIRGDRSKEESKSGGTLRTRTSVLGDIVNSTPVYVGKPNDKLFVGATFSGASTYATFATTSTVKNRTPVVYVGGNDGMLHGFNANTGEETYGYVPRSFLTSALKDYANPDYEHRYFVDGEIAVADFYDTGAAKWKTALVGTLGRGGPGVFALDVTDPGDVKFLWEKRASDTNMGGLGKNIGRPVIAQVANGDWRVLIGNGPDSADGKATLYSIGLKDGNVKKIDASSTTGNGLSAVLPRDSDGDGFADVAYGGDLKGTLWKFSSLSAASPTVMSLFSAVDPDGTAQPITAAPLAGKDPATGNIWVFFGTGRYLDTPDTTDMQVQTWYGLIDKGAEITGRTDLIERSILNEGTISGIPVRVIEEGAENDMVGKKGWFMDLITPPNTEKGERMVLPNRFQGMALVGTTRIPEVIDPCRPSGNGFVMAIDPFTGARLAKTFYDVNGDGKFDNSDTLDGDIISGIGLPSSPSNPIFVGDMMHVGQDDGTMTSMKTQGSAADTTRMSWRELLNQ